MDSIDREFVKTKAPHGLSNQTDHAFITAVDVAGQNCAISQPTGY